MTKFTDVRGCLAEPIDRGSVCRAGGKPSTGFPPGTRRAEPTLALHYRFSFMGMCSIWNFEIKMDFIILFLNFQNFHHFSTIWENKGSG